MSPKGQERRQNRFEKTLIKTCLNYVKTLRLQISEVEKLQSIRGRSATWPRCIIIKMFQVSDERIILDEPGKA